MDSESSILFIFVCKIKFENYFHLSFLQAAARFQKIIEIKFDR